MHNFPQKIEEYVEELKESGLEEFADDELFELQGKQVTLKHRDIKKK